MSKIIPCIHNGTKTVIQVEYDGIKKTLNSCNNCIEIVKLSSICDIVEYEIVDMLKNG